MPRTGRRALDSPANGDGANSKGELPRPTSPDTKRGGSDVERYLLEVSQGRRGIVPSLLRGGLGVLAPVYCAGLKTYLLPYNMGLRQRTRLGCPVICIGNLTTGGTGKTPMTQTLCRLLMAQGRRVVILSRGYGGENEYGCAVASDGVNVLLGARQAGDEAYLLAQSLPGVPVVVGKDRRVTGALAVTRFHPDIIVLDDGMQFWQLHRDLDIVLLNAVAPFDNGWTFPRGLLREPPSHLRRAGIIVLTNAQTAGAAQLEQVRQRVSRLAPDTPVFTADLVPDTLRLLNNTGDARLNDQTVLQDTASQDTVGLQTLHGRNVTALSALGNPAAFEAMLVGLGYNVVRAFRFRDHQPLSGVELGDVVTASVQAGAAIVTTEKDAVKLTGRSNELADTEIYALRVRMRIEGEDMFLNAVGGAAKLTVRR